MRKDPHSFELMFLYHLPYKFGTVVFFVFQEWGIRCNANRYVGHILRYKKTRYPPCSYLSQKRAVNGDHSLHLYPMFGCQTGEDRVKSFIMLREPILLVRLVN